MRVPRMTLYEAQIALLEARQRTRRVCRSRFCHRRLDASPSGGGLRACKTEATACAQPLPSTQVRPLHWSCLRRLIVLSWKDGLRVVFHADDGPAASRRLGEPRLGGLRGSHDLSDLAHAVLMVNHILSAGLTRSSAWRNRCSRKAAHGPLGAVLEQKNEHETSRQQDRTPNSPLIQVG